MMGRFSALFVGGFLLSYLGVISAAELTDCRGNWGPWTECQPLEGHATHHDEEDLFHLTKDENDNFQGVCFQYREFNVVIGEKGEGISCKYKNGAKQFEYCSDCSQIPATSKRLNAPPQKERHPIRILLILSSVLCLFLLIVLIAVCVRKFVKAYRKDVNSMMIFPSTQNKSADSNQQKAYPGVEQIFIKKDEDEIDKMTEVEEQNMQK